ncbi:MAG: DNA polymerase III subunit delta [Chloroflexi bacterium]|nr:DNA polymerase III subunit delta [Chloroflexota bacterium]
MKPYLLVGEDDFSLRQFLGELRQGIGVAEVWEANTTALAGALLTPQELKERCAMAPFLASCRLVVVEGLFGRFEDRGGSRRLGRAPRASPQPLGPWEGLPAVLEQVPDTTLLVFVERGVKRLNPLLRVAGPWLEAREFRPLAGERLAQWIRKRAAAAGSRITEGAVRQLGDLVGGDLWVLSNELEKLSLFAGDGTIDEKAVAATVARSREVQVFAVVDAVLEGHAPTALRGVGLLRREGAQVSHVLTMLARQLRLILLAQELLSQDLPPADLGHRLGLGAEFAVRRTVEQARRHGAQQVRAMYRSVLDVDLAIKRGELEEGLGLEMLIAELSQGVRSGGPRAPGPSGSGPR